MQLRLLIAYEGILMLAKPRETEHIRFYVNLMQFV